MDIRSVVKCMVVFRLFSCLSMSSAAGNDDSQLTITTSEPFPVFSTEPVSRDQCALQFSKNCNPLTTSKIVCEDTALEMTCNPEANSAELRQMAASLSKPPLRALFLRLYGEKQLNCACFEGIRKQVVGFQVSNCTSSRITGNLPQLRFINVLEFNLINCYGLTIYRVDFSRSSRMRLIQFYNTTLRTLERDTFTDLPALKLISLEAGLNHLDVFSGDMRDYLKRLHCGCEYDWYRRWRSSNALLLHKASAGEIYKLTYSWDNNNLTREGVYLPIDCAANPFPNGSSAIDFTQKRFSINENAFNDSGYGQRSCQGKSDDDEPFPDFSMETITQEECSLLYTKHCGHMQIYPLYTAENCSTSPLQVLEIQCDGHVEPTEMSSITKAMARFPVRPIYLYLNGIFSVTHENLTPVIKQILTFYYFGGGNNSRSVGQLKQLRLANLLHYDVRMSYNQEIHKDDFKHSPKLRIIVFAYSAIKTLEVGTFSDLPDLRVLSLWLGAGYFNMLSDDSPATGEERRFHYRLQCGCEYAWFRKWWSGNRRLLRMAERGEVISLPVLNNQYTRKEIHAPVDCATPTGKVWLLTSY